MASPHNQLLLTLSDAASQQPDRIKLAETRLKEWETAPKFYSTLLDIICDKSINGDIRHLGIIFLKNGVDKYWRKTALHAISPDEKAKIRGQLLTLMDEEQKMLATQNALIIAKVARFDYPNDWPDLLQGLLNVIHTTMTAVSDPHSRLLQKRSLLTLHQVVKALCSRTLASNRKMLEEVSPELLRNVANIYVEHTNRFFAMTSNSPNSMDQMAAELEVSILCLKSIRRLIAHGFSDFSKVEETKAFLILGLQHLQKFYNLRKTIQDTSHPVFELADSHIRMFGKMYIDLQRLQPISFSLTPDAVDIVQYYWQIIVTDGVSYDSEPPTQPPGLEKIVVQGLLLLKGVIRKHTYGEANPRGFLEKLEAVEKSTSSRLAQALSVVEGQLLTPKFVNSITENIISKFLILRNDDLNMWEDDPEGWINYDETDHWEYHVRPCAERVAMELFAQFRAALSPLILKLLESAASASDPSSLLLKDAVYSAVGLGAHELYDALDFDSLLVNHLVMEAVNTDQSVVDRSLGQRENLKGYEWDFEADQFTPYLDRSIELLSQLIGGVEHFETRVKILNTLSLIVERMEDQIAPYAQRIASLLPPLWEAAVDEHLFKPAILVTLTKLVGSLKEQSENLHELIVLLVNYSVNPNSEEHVYLLDDALDLWYVTVQCAPHSTPLLLSLVPASVALLEFGSDSLKKVLKILESYLVMAPEMVMQSFAHQIMDAFTRLLGDLKPQACSAIIQLIEVILQSCPIQLCEEHLMNTGLLWKLLNTILAQEEQYYILVNYLKVFARIVINDPVFFLGFIEISGQQSNPRRTDLLDELFGLWLDLFDNVGHAKDRKLHAMAFTALLATTNSVILNRLPQIMGVWSDVLSEVRENGGGDALIYWREESKNDDEESADSKRKRMLLQRDPIHTTNLIQYIQMKFSESEQLNGGAEAFQRDYVSKVDSTLLDQVNSLMRI
ncbi:1331_t:CDS:10 [Paraglomus brasilianum]|uniref:1331_t:CDS:1 n=1 Tax=Paraglomus brasilianum TaxID=144538 RepID=A0A9N9G9C6_9GLOM|nr:1331_t:CDS:10 [Paraglomus brasilianum]